LLRSFLIAGFVVATGMLPLADPRSTAVQAQSVTGRILAPTRSQLGWLELQAPMPMLVTNFACPSYPADVAAVPGVPFGIASIVQAFAGHGALGGDLLSIDLQSGAVSPFLGRPSEAESLDVPAIWPDGHGVLYERSNLSAALSVPGQAVPQYSRIEQVSFDGSNPTVIIEDGRYPAPGPDGSQLVFVRATATGLALFTYAIGDGSETMIVPPRPFLALSYARFSPDGQRIAFATISLLTPAGRSH